MPPKPPPPPHKSLHTPPHEKKRKSWGKRLLLSVIIGLGVTLTLGVVLWLFNIPVNTILPVAAPVWAGATTLTYTAIGDKLA